jgi:hypothetical protein
MPPAARLVLDGGVSSATSADHAFRHPGLVLRAGISHAGSR